MQMPSLPPAAPRTHPSPPGSSGEHALPQKITFPWKHFAAKSGLDQQPLLARDTFASGEGATYDPHMPLDTEDSTSQAVPELCCIDILNVLKEINPGINDQQIESTGLQGMATRQLRNWRHC